MTTLAAALVVLVALEHVGFLALEMFLWTRPAGRKVFQTTEAFARESAALAANQGLYNGFLAAGLLFGLATHARATTLFFLGCVVVAGLFGAATVSRRILVVQALPAAIAMAVAIAAH